MEYLGLILLVVGAVLLVVGYRGNSRNILVVAALLLLASHALPEFVAGVQEGYSGARAQAVAPAWRDSASALGRIRMDKEIR